MGQSRQNRLRHVVIGGGAGIFKSHLPGLKLPNAELVALSDINAEPAQQRANELRCAFYTDYRQMLAESRADVAVILTPHPLHARIAIDCLRVGCHVLVEKPMAIQVAEADAMIETAEQHQRLLAVVFQHRFRPEIRTAHQIIQEGRLGQLERVEMSAVWTRPKSYFQQAPWRGTWSGEGGGVLMNQAMHNLDVLCYLVGELPQRLHAWTRRLLHQIETEDTGHAMLEWSGGALGSLHISTAEADVSERIKLVGTHGILEIEPDKLTFQQFETGLHEYAATCPDPYGKVSSHLVSVKLEDGDGKHVSVYRNLHDAILHGSLLSSDGVQGRMSLELANAMIYSSYTHSEVELPLDRQKYASLLQKLQTHQLIG